MGWSVWQASHLLPLCSRQEEALKADIDAARKDGDENTEKALNDVKQLEDAVRKHKQDLAQQALDHQKLLDLKLSLDIEIATYRKLLEGEERRYVTRSQTRYERRDPDTNVSFFSVFTKNERAPVQHRWATIFWNKAQRTWSFRQAWCRNYPVNCVWKDKGV